MRIQLTNRKGQALVESSPILVVFLAVIIGTLDFGQYLYFHQTLSERARAAARYRTVNWSDRTGIQNLAVYNDPSGTANGATPLMPSFRTWMVAVCLPGDTSCADPANTTESVITVTISGYQMTTFSLFMPQSFTNRPITVSLPSEKPVS